MKTDFTGVCTFIVHANFTVRLPFRQRQFKVHFWVRLCVCAVKRLRFSVTTFFIVVCISSPVVSKQWSLIRRDWRMGSETLWWFLLLHPAFIAFTRLDAVLPTNGEQARTCLQVSRFNRVTDRYSGDVAAQCRCCWEGHWNPLAGSALPPYLASWWTEPTMWTRPRLHFRWSYPATFDGSFSEAGFEWLLVAVLLLRMNFLRAASPCNSASRLDPLSSLE